MQKLLRYSCVCFFFVRCQIALTGEFYMQLSNEDKGFFRKISEEIFGEDNSEGQFSLGVLISYTQDFKKDQKLEYSFQQDVFTPGRLGKRSSNAVLGDRAFAGYLAFGFNYLRKDQTRISWITLVSKADLLLGVIGPNSQAEAVQNYGHRLIGGTEYLGWKDQLENSYGANFTVRVIPQLRTNFKGLDAEVAPHAVISVGNFVGYQGIGITLRFGKHLSSDFGPKDFSPYSTKNPTISNHKGYSWNLFVGIERRHLSHNYLLQGVTSRSRIVSVQMKDYLTDVQVGVIVNLKHFLINVSFIQRGLEFTTQENKQQFVTVGSSIKI